MLRSSKSRAPQEKWFIVDFKKPRSQETWEVHTGLCHLRWMSVSEDFHTIAMIARNYEPFISNGYAH